MSSVVDNKKIKMYDALSHKYADNITWEWFTVWVEKQSQFKKWLRSGLKEQHYPHFTWKGLLINNEEMECTSANYYVHPKDRQVPPPNHAFLNRRK